MFLFYTILIGKFLQQQFSQMEVEDSRITISNTFSIQSRDLSKLLSDMSNLSAKSRIDAIHIYNQIDQYFTNSHFLEALAKIIREETSHSSSKYIKYQIIKGATCTLKYYSQYFLLPETERQSFLNLVISLIIKNDLDYPIKAILGETIRFQLDEDQNLRCTKVDLYRKTIFERINNLLKQESNIYVVDSCIVLISAIFNSLLDMPDQMSAFFQEILQFLLLMGNKLYQQAVSIQINEPKQEKQNEHHESISYAIERYFDFIESISKDLRDSNLQSALNIIRHNQFFITLIHKYLTLFADDQSVISTKIQTSNNYKCAIGRTLCIFYEQAACPPVLFRIMLNTVIYQSKEIINNIENEVIVMSALQLLGFSLSRKEFIPDFDQFKMLLVYAMLTYSVTNADEDEMMSENFNQFLELADGYVNGNDQINYIKVKTGVFLKKFAQSMPDGLTIIVETVINILKHCLCKKMIMQEEANEKPLEYKNFVGSAFHRLGDESKCEACLMVLAGLSKQIHESRLLKNKVYQFMDVEGQHLRATPHPIVMLRLIRTISFFPSDGYFKYIENRMNRGELFMLEGINAFVRIHKYNDFPEVSKVITSIFIKILDGFRISESVMVNLTKRFYFSVLCVEGNLYKKFVAKLAIAFYQSFGNYIHNQVSYCFSLLQYFLEREDNIERFKFVEMAVMQLTGNLIKEQDPKYLKAHLEDLIRFYHTIVKRRVDFKFEIQQFLMTTLKWLETHRECRPSLFQFYSIFFGKFHGSVKLSRYFNDFLEEVKRRVLIEEELNASSLDIAAHLCFLMSQLIALPDDLALSNNHQKSLLKIVQKLPKDYKQYPLLVLFAYIYKKPYNVTYFLKKNTLYSIFFAQVAAAAFEGINRKLLNLAFVKLLEIEEDLSFLQPILHQCIINFKPLKLSGFFQELLQPELIYPIKITDLLTGFHHPLEKQNELNQLKNIALWWKDERLISSLDPDSSEVLKIIMQASCPGCKKRVRRN